MANHAYGEPYFHDLGQLLRHKEAVHGSIKDGDGDTVVRVSKKELARAGYALPRDIKSGNYIRYRHDNIWMLISG